MSISLCCIVNNEQQFLADMLLSVKGLADELIVVDTGSEDSSTDIALDAGAQVFNYTWNDDFASARNFSISKAQSDWILVLDADERIETAHHEKILDLISISRSSAFFLQRRHYLSNDSVPYFTPIDSCDPRHKMGAVGYYTTSDLRLFPRDPPVRFTGAVHESAEESAAKLSLNISYQQIVIHHLGPLLAFGKSEAKNDLYLKLAQKKLAENPDDWRNWFQVAAELQAKRSFEDAMEHFKKAVSLFPGFHESWRQIGICLAALGRFDESIDYLSKAINLKPSCAITLNALGVAFSNINMLNEAVTCFEAALDVDPVNSISRQNLNDLLKRLK